MQSMGCRCAKCGVQACKIWGAGVQSVGCRHAKFGVQAGECRVHMSGAGMQNLGCRHAECGEQAWGAGQQAWGAAVQNVGCKRGEQAWGAGMQKVGSRAVGVQSAGSRLLALLVAETPRSRCRSPRRSVYLFSLQSVGQVSARLAKPEARCCPFAAEGVGCAPEEQPSQPLRRGRRMGWVQVPSHPGITKGL